MSKERLRDKLLENTQSNVAWGLIQWNRLPTHNSSSKTLREKLLPVFQTDYLSSSQSLNQFFSHKMEKVIAERKMMLPFRSEKSQGSWLIALSFVWTLPDKNLRGVGKLIICFPFFCFFSSVCFLKEIGNMYFSVFRLTYTETRVKAWENSKKMWKPSPVARSSPAFIILPQTFTRVSITRQRNGPCFVFIK